MGRHSAHHDQTDIIAQVVEDVSLHEFTQDLRFAPMFKGMHHHTDELPAVDEEEEQTEAPPKGANPSALWTVSVVAVIMTIASLALAAYLELRPAPQSSCPTKLIPSKIVTPAPVTITEHP